MISTRNADMDNKTSKNVFKMCCATLRLCETAFPHLWFLFWFCRSLVLYLMSCKILNPYICSNLSYVMLVLLTFGHREDWLMLSMPRTHSQEFQAENAQWRYWRKRIAKKFNI